MFKTMFANSERIENSAMLIFPWIDRTYEELVPNLKLINSELNKEKVSSKGERVDFVAELVGSAYKFHPTIQINLNNFKFKGNDDIVSDFYFQDEKGNILMDDLIIRNISVPNIKQKCYNEGIEALSEGERYILALSETDTDKARQIGKGYTYMQESIDKQIEYGEQPILFEAYDKEWAARDESHREGFEEGHASGIEEGQLSIIKYMMSNGMSIENISTTIGISVEEIKSLLDS